MNSDFSRRQMLLGVAGLGAFMTTGAARAMSRETVSGNSELGQSFANHCTAQTDSAHAQLIGDLQAMLMQKGGNKGDVLTQTAYCPICGCPVTVTRRVD